MLQLAVGALLLVALLLAIGPGRSSAARARTLVYLAAWGALSVRVGVRLDLASVAALTILLLDRSVRGLVLGHSLTNKLALPLFACALTSAWLTQIFRPHFAELLASEGASHGWGQFQVAYRLPIQTLRWFLVLLIPVVVIALARQVGFDLIVRYVVEGVTISVGFGLIQTAVQFVGGPWPSASTWGPVFDGNFGIREQIQYAEVGPLLIPRLFGMAGEPKHTAASILFAMVALAALRQSATLDQRWFKRVRLVLSAGLFLTFSTGAYVLAGLVVPLLLLRQPGRYMGPKFGGANRVLIASGLALGLALSGLFGPLVDARLLGRFEGVFDVQTSFEPKDAAALQVFVSEPWALVGFGPGLADGAAAERMPSSRNTFIDGAIPTPTYTVNRLLLESGVLGFAVYVVYVLSLGHDTVKPRRKFTMAIGFLGLVTPFHVFSLCLIVLAGVAGRPKSSGKTLFHHRQQHQGREFEAVVLTPT